MSIPHAMTWKISHDLYYMKATRRPTTTTMSGGAPTFVGHPKRELHVRRLEEHVYCIDGGWTLIDFEKRTDGGWFSGSKADAILPGGCKSTILGRTECSATLEV